MQMSRAWLALASLCSGRAHAWLCHVSSSFCCWFSVVNPSELSSEFEWMLHIAYHCHLQFFKYHVSDSFYEHVKGKITQIYCYIVGCRCYNREAITYKYFTKCYSNTNRSMDICILTACFKILQIHYLHQGYNKVVLVLMLTTVCCLWNIFQE